MITLMPDHRQSSSLPGTKPGAYAGRSRPAFLLAYMRESGAWFSEDQNSQLADAALMHLSEREGVKTAFTLDRREFGVYRPGKGKTLHVIPD